MLPFALPLFLCPRIASRCAGRLSGRAMLTAGLLVVAAGDLFWPGWLPPCPGC